MSTAERETLRVGTLIAGSYRVVRPLAEGGMGVIYEVEQVATGARRALKVMRLQFAGDDALRARFVREARLTASLPTDHVAQVLDAGLDPPTGLLFMVMELLEGMTLSQRIRRLDAFAWNDALTVLGQVAHALRAAHALGVVHRDLKPANVFLAHSRQAGAPFMVKLLDFGIAKALAVASDVSAVGLGTPSWMAPEQAAIDEHIGPQADVWAFGLLAFLVLTGRHYFAAANAPSVATAAVLREVLLDPLAPASQRAAEVGFEDRLPKGFDAWFASCVDRDPKKRFPEGGAAFDALALLPAPEPIATPSPSLARVRAASALRVKTPITAVETPNPSRPGVLRIHASVASASPPPATSSPSTESRAAQRPPWMAWSVAAVGVGAALAVSAWTRNRDVPRAAAIATPVLVAPSPSRVVLRLHGSNTMGVELVPALAEAFLRRSTGAPTIVRRRTASDEVSVEARDADRGVDSIEVFAHGSSTAFVDLLDGTCDLGMASRRVHDDEMKKGPALRNLTSAANEHVIGLDGIAVIVNPSNPVSSLTRARIRDAFDGTVRRWSDVGGEDRPIVVHARDDRSGTYDTFRLLVLEDRPLASGAIRQESSEELSDAVAAETGAVGFIGLPYVRSAKAIMVQDSATVPMLPSPMSVATEDYPLARRLYLYAPQGASATAREFVDFALSDDGQRIVRAAGFVDLQPKCDTSGPACLGCTREYLDAVHGACRLSVDFRFDVGLNLDTRALRDLNRVVGLLGRPEYAGRNLVLLGFSDGQVARTEGLRLSRERAAVVAQQLRARGLGVAVERGMGAIMPVADDGSEEGRQRNRRVEAWLR